MCVSHRLSDEHTSAVDRLVRTSGKMVLLDKLMRRLKETGHRVLIFSQVRGASPKVPACSAVSAHEVRVCPACAHSRGSLLEAHVASYRAVAALIVVAPGF